jgi:hypothetical protein
VHIQDARFAEDHIQFSKSTVSAVSASEKWRIREKFLVSERQAGKPINLGKEEFYNDND